MKRIKAIFPISYILCFFALTAYIVYDIGLWCVFIFQFKLICWYVAGCFALYCIFKLEDILNIRP